METKNHDALHQDTTETELLKQDSTETEAYYNFNCNNQYYNFDTYYKGLDDAANYYTTIPENTITTQDYYSILTPDYAVSTDLGYTKLSQDLLTGGTIIKDNNATNLPIKDNTITCIKPPAFCFSTQEKFNTRDPQWNDCVEEIIRTLHDPSPTPPTTPTTINTLDLSETTSSSSTPDVPEHTDWNGRFQTALELPMTTPTLEANRAEQIGNVCREFQQEVTKIAKIIIEEVHTTDSTKKRIPPSLDVGGQAGGEKFIHNSVLYKFARDWRGIYAGQEGAMKAAGCELRGLHAIAGAGITKLCVPLCNVIDYQGWRLVAVAILPIDDKTLVYGSDDCGGTVHAKDIECNELMRQLGINLNVAEHQVKCRKPPHSIVTVAGPADLEVHRGRDGRIYCLDAVSLFCCCCLCRTSGRSPCVLLSNATPFFSH